MSVARAERSGCAERLSYLERIVTGKDIGRR